MIINKNKVFLVTLLVTVAVVLAIYLLSILGPRVVDEPLASLEPSATISSSPTPLPTPRPLPSRTPLVSKVPLPTGDGRTNFIDEKVPWELLLADASCELKGEIKFLNEKTYDNQDALFIYKGIDHPGRNVKWMITPAELNLEVGPNIFSKIPIPNSQSLLGLFPKGPLGYKRYELTAVIEYGRLIDEKGNFVTAGGNVKVFEKSCQGKTIVVFP